MLLAIDNFVLYRLIQSAFRVLRRKGVKVVRKIEITGNVFNKLFTAAGLLPAFFR
jgi:hypothetical protein